MKHFDLVISSPSNNLLKWIPKILVVPHPFWGSLVETPIHMSQEKRHRGAALGHQSCAANGAGAGLLVSRWLSACENHGERG